jgi:hypothetical protein
MSLDTITSPKGGVMCQRKKMAKIWLMSTLGDKLYDKQKDPKERGAYSRRDVCMKWANFLLESRTLPLL